MLEMGAFVIGGFVVMISLVVHYIKLDNEMLRRKEAWRQAEKWNWD